MLVSESYQWYFIKCIDFQGYHIITNVWGFDLIHGPYKPNKCRSLWNKFLWTSIVYPNDSCFQSNRPFYFSHSRSMLERHSISNCLLKIWNKVELPLNLVTWGTFGGKNGAKQLPSSANECQRGATSSLHLNHLSYCISSSIDINRLCLPQL